MQSPFTSKRRLYQPSGEPFLKTSGSFCPTTYTRPRRSTKSQSSALNPVGIPSGSNSTNRTLASPNGACASITIARDVSPARQATRIENRGISGMGRERTSFAEDA